MINGGLSLDKTEPPSNATVVIPSMTVEAGSPPSRPEGKRGSVRPPGRNGSSLSLFRAGPFSDAGEGVLKASRSSAEHLVHQNVRFAFPRFTPNPVVGSRPRSGLKSIPKIKSSLERMHAHNTQARQILQANEASRMELTAVADDAYQNRNLPLNPASARPKSLKMML